MPRPDLNASKLHFDPATNARALVGHQCPECYGVRINIRRDRGNDRVNGFECQECGCQFGSH